MSAGKVYDLEYKIQALKLANEIGQAKAAAELGIPKSTVYITKAELKVKIWRYFMSYWNNRRICSSNGGLPPMIKRRKYYAHHEEIA